MNVEPDEVEQLLIKTARLTEENNKILRRMQRAQRTAVLMRVIHWAVIIGSFAFLYYLLQPYVAEVKALSESYQSILRSDQNESRYDLIETFLQNLDPSELLGGEGQEAGGATPDEGVPEGEEPEIIE